jgi:cytochrome c5
MRRRLAAIVLALVLGGVTRLGADETVSITLPPDQTRLADGPGRDVAETQCRMCHSLDYVTTQPRGGAAQWQGVVTKMRAVYAAPITDADAKVISEYLAAHYGSR